MVGSNGGAKGVSGTAGSVSFSYTAYTLGGTITGLTAGGLVLSAGTTPNQTVSPASSATAFTFANAFMGNYNVTVQTQPTGLLCTVANAAGSIGTANVTNVAVTCRPSADLGITKTSTPTTFTVGSSVSYSVIARNYGPNPVTGATVTDTFPTSLSACAWTCAPAGGGTCTAAGSGNINDTAVNLPLNASVTYTVGCTVSPTTAPGSVVVNTANVTVPATMVDPNLANNSASASNTAKANQTITFGAQPGQTYAPGGTFTINPVATASSGLPVSYAVGPNTVCTLGSGTTVNIIGAGTCAITASQAGDANYNAATAVTQNVTIAKAAQTLTFPAQTRARRTFVDGGTFSINPVATSASPNSGSTITYSSLTPLVCTVSGTTVSMLKPGTCTIAADQAGNSNYLDAPQVTQDVVIVPAPTAIPTLNEWGLMLMGLLAAGLGMRRLRRW